MRFHPVPSFWLRFTKYAALAGALAFALALSASNAAAQDDSEKSYSKIRIVRLSFVQGDVQIFRPEETDWEKAMANMPIQEGYSIGTGRGRAEIEFESGATVRLAENTQVQFNQLALSDGDRLTRMTLSEGSAIFYANLARNDQFTVVTPGVEVSIPRNSRFRMDVTEKHVNVAVLKGDVTVQTRDGSYKLAKNQALLFDARGEGNSVIARAAEPDDFERWAADRDDSLNRSRDSSLQYVSAPFRYGVGDLSNHGTWVYAAPYGYVWRPYGVYAGWTPYYDGRWVYTRGYGWTWVSYEPWGWLPYHYGSWVYVGSYWSWVPGSLHRHHWHPGLVVWLNFGGGRYGWCARNPFDRPGHVYYNTRIHNTIIINTGHNIITGGRHDRWRGDVRDGRGGRDFRFDNDGPRDRNHFGNVDTVRASFGGRREAGDPELGRRRFSGRTEDRFVKGDVSGNTAVSSGTSGVAAGSDVRTRGNAGFGGRNDAIDRGRNEGRPAMDTRSGDDNRPRRFEGRTEDRAKPVDRDVQPTQDLNDSRDRRGFSGNGNGNNDRFQRDGVPPRRSIGDPNTSVEFDSQRRRYENQPRTNVEVERDRGDFDRGRMERNRNDNDGNRGRPAFQPDNSRPDSRNDNRGEWGGRSRMPESRPEPRNEPRSGFGGRSGGDSPRPSSPPPRAESPRPSSGSFGGSRGDSGGGGGGFGGGRPSSPSPSAGSGGHGSGNSGGGRPGGGGGRPRGNNN